MKAFLAACLVIAAIAVAADLGLDRAGFSTAERNTTGASVRLE